MQVGSMAQEAAVMSRRCSVSLIMIFFAGRVAGQPPAPKEFEVASVRPNRLNDRIVTIDVGPGGRFAARGYTLKLLIQRAYGVMGWNISGGPSWLDEERYDVSAKAAVVGDLKEQQLMPMLQALLSDRFQLRVHRESREISGYALIIARGGPKFKPGADRDQDNFRLTETGVKAKGITMANFARFVGGKLGLSMVDLTGLPGTYDIEADWVADTDSPAGGLPADPREALRSAVFTALPSKLGLKINAQKIAAPILVIDRAQRASEN